jgi:hypothetical protein
MCEQGVVSDTFGYNSSTIFNQVRENFENFYVMGMTVEWCPTSLRGFAPVQNASPQGVVGPFLWSDDPDNYSQNAYNDD